MNIKKKQKRIPKWRIDGCIRLCMHYYFEDKNIKEFEKHLKANKFDKGEVPRILYFFKKEIYPVDKQVAKWLWNYQGSNSNIKLKSRMNELKKIGYKIVKCK